MKKAISLVAVLAAFTLYLTANVFAAMNQYKAGDIVIENPWARATMSIAKTAAAYLTIKNTGSSPDKLVAVHSAISKKAGIHQSLMEDGIMKMRPVKALDVTPGGMTMLKPGSYHIMFMGLKAPLKMGETFPLTLVFEKSGEVEITVKIMKTGAMRAMKMAPSD